MSLRLMALLLASAASVPAEAYPHERRMSAISGTPEPLDPHSGTWREGAAGQARIEAAEAKRARKRARRLMEGR